MANYSLNPYSRAQLNIKFYSIDKNKLNLILNSKYLLNDFEKKFIESIENIYSNRRKMSEKQNIIFEKIYKNVSKKSSILIDNFNKIIF